MLTRRQYSRTLLAAPFVRLLRLLPLLPLSVPSASAQDALPKKPISLVIGFPPGGAIDTVARIVAQHLTQKLGQTVVVQNRPGAGGNIAQQQVFQAEPDGSTLLLGTIGSLVINPRLMKLP